MTSERLVLETANGLRLFWSTVAGAFHPPPPPDFLAWAERNVVFGGESPLPGPYNIKRFPFFRRLFEVLGPEHPARVVTLRKSAQIGGTVLAQIFLGGTLVLDPCQELCYHPTETNAEDWVKLKWKPFLRSSTAMRTVLGAERSRDGSQSLMFYERLDGMGSLVVAGANSGPALSMKSARVQVQDDLSKWEFLKSGDSETQADSRSKAFILAKIFKCSTPLIEPGCRITNNFNAGTQEYWEVPCRACGHSQALEWENMLATLDQNDPDDAHFTCVACGCRIDYRDQEWMNERGDWVMRNPAAAKQGLFSFHLWAAYSVLESWANLARAWFAAKGSPESEKSFTNDTAGLAYKGASEFAEWSKIKERADEAGHEIGIIPHGGLIFVVGIDVQKSYLAVHVKTFGRDRRRWTVEYRTIDGHIGEAATMERLDALLAETWPDAYGNRRRLDMVAIDGNAWTTEVFDWAKRHPWTRVIVTRGSNQETAPPIAPVVSERKLDGKPKRQQKRFYNLGVSGLKMSLYTALAEPDPLARSFCGYPKEMAEDFYRQLCSEVRKASKRFGSLIYRWVKEDANLRNEVLDTELIAEGAARRLGWGALTASQADEIEARLTASGAVAKATQPDLFDAGHEISRKASSEAAAAPPSMKALLGF